VKAEHIKLSGKPIRPREGILVEAGPEKIVLRRSLSQGRYDGLDLPIEKGDFSLSEIREHDWYVKHRYYNQDGKLKGEYYNINTPVEVYPYGARYLDLEIDVIRRPGERPFLTDREELSIARHKGLIGPGLEKKALEVAEDMMRQMSFP
jgi:probable ribonuclease FAU-1